MGIGVSLFLVAVGAILEFAVSATARGINIHVVGVIFMIVGAIGFLCTMLFWSSFAPFSSDRRSQTIIER